MILEKVKAFLRGWFPRAVGLHLDDPYLYPEINDARYLHCLPLGMGLAKR
jgi:hypothetical protein